MFNVGDFKVVGYDKKGEQYDVAQVAKVALNRINSEDYFRRHPIVAEAISDVEQGKERLDRMLGVVFNTIEELNKSSEHMVAKTKIISGQVRDATEKLSVGLAKVEKTANFDRLERYVDLLERAAFAMNTLAELDRSGKLEKIAGALK